MKERLLLSSPHMSDEGFEQEFVKEAFDTNWIAPLGSNVDGFEGDIVNYTHTKYALATNSGTAAIHLALIVAGVGNGDKVLCQSLTFSASANPIYYQGAEPIFIGSERDTWNMDPQALEQALIEQPETKAVIVVHLYGIPAKITEISEICKKHNVILIEDAAESLGSTFNGQMTGTFGDYGIYSFNGNKIITTSGGGMLVSNDLEKINLARKLSTQAREEAIHYEHKLIGYNYRLSNVSAGIGRGQMKILDKRVKRKQEIYFRYMQNFSKLDEIEMMPYPEGTVSNCWLSAIVLKNHNPISVIDYLNSHNIESRPIWKPMHQQPVFSHHEYYGSNYESELFDNGLCLPSDSKMTNEQIDHVSNLIISHLMSDEGKA